MSARELLWAYFRATDDKTEKTLARAFDKLVETRKPAPPRATRAKTLRPYRNTNGWSKRFPEKKRLLDSNWRSENKDRYAQLQRNWCEKNPEQVAGFKRDWASRNPEKIKAAQKKWRRKLNATGKMRLHAA